MALPIALYSTAQVRALDAHAIKDLGIPGYTLMKRAGEAALRYLREIDELRLNQLRALGYVR